LFYFCFYVLLDFFNRVFGRFVTRGVRKRDKNNQRIFPQPPKKEVAYLRHFVFYGAPWGRLEGATEGA
jgi:hypothetical protein